MLFALVIFGPNRLPEIGRQVGKAIREVRKLSGSFQEEIRTTLALDDDANFPYMSGPIRREAPPAPAGEVPPAPVTPPAPQVVRYGEVRPAPVPQPPADDPSA